MKRWFFKNRLWVGLVLIVIGLGYFTFVVAYYLKIMPQRMSAIIEPLGSSDSESIESEPYFNGFNEDDSDSSDKSISANEDESLPEPNFDERDFVFRGEKNISTLMIANSCR